MKDITNVIKEKDMKELKFRNLTKDEIEVRVGAGGTLLLYKTARVDANLLDEVVGCFNWQKKFYQVKQTMICEVGININYDDPNKEPLFIFKGDAGDESQTEAIKGEASDSFKRAGFAWGIGRSLYTAPKIKLPDEFKNSKFFDVSEIEYNSKNEISKLVITTDFGKTVVYSYPKYQNNSKSAQKPTQNVNEYGEVKSNPKPTLDELGKGIGDSFLEESSISEETKDKINEITGKFSAERYTNFKTYLYNTFQVSSIGDLTEEQGKKLLKVLSK